MISEGKLWPASMVYCGICSSGIPEVFIQGDGVEVKHCDFMILVHQMMIRTASQRGILLRVLNDILRDTTADDIPTQEFDSSGGWVPLRMSIPSHVH